jgi:ATP-binding cassette subfamily F protein 2
MPAKKKVEKAASSDKAGKGSVSAAPAAASSSSASAAESAADRLRDEGIVVTFAQSSKKIHRNQRDISVSNLTMLFHGTPLVEEAELTLNYGNRYGFIGRNGCG